LCRKVAQAKDGVIEVWGSGNQTRSFLYIDDCVDGIERLMASSYTQPINLGSDRLISINELATLIGQLAGKPVTVNNIPGPQGVMGRNSNNDLVRTVLNWAPPDSLETGLHVLYNWIKTQHND
jgi:nucleoside-diphosphate-sugar epimerase